MSAVLTLARQLPRAEDEVRVRGAALDVARDAFHAANANLCACIRSVGRRHRTALRAHREFRRAAALLRNRQRQLAVALDNYARLQGQGELT